MVTGRVLARNVHASGHGSRARRARILYDLKGVG